MHIRKLLMLTTVLLAGAVSVVGQEGEKVVDGRYTPSAEEMERSKRNIERLQKAEVFTMKLEPSRYKLRDNRTEADQYKAGGEVRFEFAITNTSPETIEVRNTMDTHSEDRPQLFKDGKLVPYHKKAARMVEVKDRGDTARRAIPITLEPGKVFTQNIDLKDWYEPLEPGSYRLTVRHRFIWGGEWIESSPITFEVVPE